MDDWAILDAAFSRGIGVPMPANYRDELNRMIEQYLPDIYATVQTRPRKSKAMSRLRSGWRLRDAVFRAHHDGLSEHEVWGINNPEKRCRNCEHICSRYGEKACSLEDGPGGSYMRTHGESWCSLWSPQPQKDT